MRLDKFLSTCNIGSRKEVKKLISNKKVKVNGQIQKNLDTQIDEINDKIELNDKLIEYQQNYYYLLNKPAGYLCATFDKNQKTIMDLFKNLNKKLVNRLFPVGRLDIDTEGMIIVTNDGDFCHRLTNPKHHINKVYFVEYDKELPLDASDKLSIPIKLKDGTIYQPARIKIIDSNHCYLTICEGQFHQVKRMIAYLGSNVTSLKRVRIGGLDLPDTLKCGEYISLGKNELELILRKD